MPGPASYRRYVALGDSQTEGLNDGDDATGLRGWADRFAEALAATTSPELHYANLAVRGCRARDVRHNQLDPALALQPDLASVVVGMNDLLRHDYDADATVRDVEETFAALRATGCRVVTMTFPDIGRMLPVMAWLRPREVDLNRRLVEAAVRHDVAVLDLFPLACAATRRCGATTGSTAAGRDTRGSRPASASCSGSPAATGPGACPRRRPPACSTPYDVTRGGRRPSSYRSSPGSCSGAVLAPGARPSART